jgi:hypothetical protein
MGVLFFLEVYFFSLGFEFLLEINFVLLEIISGEISLDFFLQIILD